MKNIFQYTVFTAVITVALPAVTVGQEAERSSAIEEIIVTAERREQSLQDVPLSITAFSGDTRDRIGIISIQDMSDFAPGFTFNMATDRPAIRGIGRQSNTFSLDSPVANYNDGIYTSSVQDAQRAPMFVDRTEILRGPQGALSGRGSIAGAVSTHLKRPSDEFEMETRVFAKNYSGYGGGLTVSGPVADNIRLRLNLADSEQDDGFYENVTNGNWEGSQPYRRQTADYMMEMDITENLDWYLKASFTSYDESRRTGGNRAPYPISDIEGLPASAYGYLGAGIVPPAAYGYGPGNGIFVGPAENPSVNDYRQFSSNFNSYQKLDNHHNYVSHLTWNTDEVQIKWIAGHQNYYYEQQQDGDGTAVTSVTLPFFGRVVDPSTINQYDEQRQWYSNEFTIASANDGVFTWLAGLYHSNEEYVQHPLVTYNPGYDELATPAFGSPANTHGNASVFGEVRGETNSYAIFGQTEFQMSDEIKLTVGLRKNWDKKDVEGQTRYIGNNFATPGAPFFPVGSRFVDLGMAVDVTTAYDPVVGLPRGVVDDYVDPTTGRRVREMEGEWDALAGTVGVDYTPNDDTLIYFRLASGYRPGGFDAPYLRDDPIVDEESVLSYEIGYKGTIAEQFQLNASAFLYDFQDQQLPLPALGRCDDPNDLNTCTIITDFKNLPETQNWGVEVEGTWYATDNLSFFLSYGYLKTEIKDGGEGFQNPLDPAALLSGANRMSPILQNNDNMTPVDTSDDFLEPSLDLGFTNNPRWLQDISGNSLANSPEHKVALNTSYTMDFQAGNLLLSANYVWRGDSQDDVFNTPVAVIDGYGTFSARAIWADADDDYSIIFYVSNLTDEEARDGGGAVRRATAATGAAGQVYYESYNLNPPRTYGLEVQYRFNN